MSSHIASVNSLVEIASGRDLPAALPSRLQMLRNMRPNVAEEDVTK